jgi:hypothetical protein
VLHFVLNVFERSLAVTAYLIFVALGATLTLLVGQLLLRSGQVYLEDVFDGDRRLATSVNRLLAVLFHLVMLGVLALISTISVPVDGAAQTVITKLGVVLIVLGGGHAATMWGLGRARARRAEQRLLDAWPGSSVPADAAAPGRTATPAGSRRPAVAEPAAL